MNAIVLSSLKLNIARMIKNGHRYSYKSSSSIGLEVLMDWLTDDLHDFQGWKNWILTGLDSISSNATILEKTDDYIVLGSEVDAITKRDFYMPSKYTITISKSNLLELVDAWELLLQEKPNEIIITEENGVYKMFAVQ